MRATHADFQGEQEHAHHGDERDQLRCLGVAHLPCLRTTIAASLRRVAEGRRRRTRQSMGRIPYFGVQDAQAFGWVAPWRIVSEATVITGSPDEVS
jgi:hypothetical protein